MPSKIRESDQRFVTPPPSMAPAESREATVSIVNLSDQDFYISRTYGIFHIPACPKGEPYAILLITNRGDALDLGDNRRFPFTISAREIATDLIQDLEPHGIFVSTGARPSEDEIATAQGRDWRGISSLSLTAIRCGLGVIHIGKFLTCIAGRRCLWGSTASGRSCHRNLSIAQLAVRR